MKMIILDRDGVINHDSPDFIKSPAEWVPIPGSLEAIARLNQAGYRVVIASNQSGIARELFDMTTLNAIHQKLHASAQQVGADIDAIFFCPHAAIDNCDCRKPKSGMFEEIAKRFKVSLKGVPTVGDSLRDLQAGYVKRLRALPGPDRQGPEDQRDRRPAARHPGVPRPGRDGRRPAAPKHARRRTQLKINQ
jgi:D-glycero-D-manno-heptose 1,7-bisphosphate phosphatase